MERFIPGQYAGMKITVATQAFLTERGGGPLPVMTILEGLKAGGLKTLQTRSKDPKKQNLLRDPNHRDLLRQANSNRPRYVYDMDKDTIALRTSTEGMTASKVSKHDRAADLRAS